MHGSQTTELLLARLARAARNDDLAAEAETVIRRLLLDLTKESAAADLLAQRNAALVTEIDSLRQLADYGGTG
jgi:hypothetical protein